MKKNKKRFSNAAVMVFIALAIPFFAFAQQAGSSRTELQRHDLSTPGREMVQVRVDIERGTVYPRHSHFGEEVVYVLDGTLEYRLDGKEPIILNAGGVLFIPYGAVHTVKNTGTGKAVELATYIVEKDKPLVTVAK